MRLTRSGTDRLYRSCGPCNDARRARATGASLPSTDLPTARGYASDNSAIKGFSTRYALVTLPAHLFLLGLHYGSLGHSCGLPHSGRLPLDIQCAVPCKDLLWDMPMTLAPSQPRFDL